MNDVRRPRFLAAASSAGPSPARFGSIGGGVTSPRDSLRAPTFIRGVSNGAVSAAGLGGVGVGSLAVSDGFDRSEPLEQRLAEPALPPAAPVHVCNHPPPPQGLDPRVAVAVESLRHASQHLAEQARQDALEVGLLVARRILEHEIQTDPRHLMAIIRDTLQRLGETREVTVRLSPEDLERLGKLEGEARGGIAQVKLEADPTLSLGDCCVESDMGSVDNRLQDRIAEAGRLLRETFDDASGASAA